MNSACQGKPHIGPSGTQDAGCWFAAPKAPDCGCFSRPANPRISRYAGFLENSVTQIVPARIAWLRLSGKYPVGLGIPPLEVKNLLDSNPPKSRI